MYRFKKPILINIGEKVWVISPEDIVNIAILFSTGVYSCKRTIAVSGSPVSNPQYFKTTIGSDLFSILKKLNIDSSTQNRYINGDVFSGIEVQKDSHIDFYNNLVSIIPEGNKHRFFGWLPFFIIKFQVYQELLSPGFLAVKVIKLILI